MDETRRRILLAVAVLLIGAAILVIEAPWQQGSTVPPPPGDLPASAEAHPAAPNFAGATDWLNGDPVSLVEQRGSVVLVDFWTYSCINCINTFPHLRGWWSTYRDDGLTIVGVHTPEFGFERDPANVRKALDRHDLGYPVAVDNDYEIWQAYDNRFWPSKYLIDQHGRIRFSWAGEGGYDRTETKIRELLVEAGRDPGPWSDVDADHGGYRPGQTRELFASTLGGDVSHDIGNDAGHHPGRNVTYSLPAEVAPDRILLGGTWYNGEESVVAREPAVATVNFTAGGANLVAGAPNGTCAPIRLDGEPMPENLAGPDVVYEAGPCVPVEGKRAYDVYSGPFESHLLRLEVPEGFELHTFAFSEEGRER